MRPKSKQTGVSTLEDVARRAGVASSTASYVLNNKPKSIGSDTRERVWSAARALSYRPNMAARSLVTRRTNIIALWVPDVASAFTARVIAESQRQVRQSGYEVLISEIHMADRESGIGQVRAEPPLASVHPPLWDVDGIIAFLGSACRDIHLDSFGTRATPVVSMGAFPLDGTDFVGVELFTGAQAAVRRLAAGGCRRLGYLVPARANFRGDDRHEAYWATIRETGLEPIVIPTHENTRAAARAAVSSYLEHTTPMDGLFCYNDEASIGAYRALRSAGLRVPDDVALIGCDGISDVEYLDCPLSTIVLPVEEMCATTWRFLEQRLQDPALSPQKIIYSGGLELRESVRPLPQK